MEPAEALPTSKPVEGVTRNSPSALDEYKIVKVRKPDGTIVKVRRPITKADGTGMTTSTSPPSPKDVGKHSEGKAVIPGESSAPSKSTGLKSPEEPDKAAQTGTNSTHASKLETTAKSYHLFRRFHRVHTHAARLAEAFDPYSDVGDFHEGDEPLESNTEYGDSVSEDSDDEDRNNNQQSNGTALNKGASTGAHVNLKVGSHAATYRAAPSTQQAKANVSVQEIHTDKSSSTDADSVNREKALLNTKDLEAANTLPKPPRSLHRRYGDWTKFVVWKLVVILPLLFIALAIATACLNHRRADRYNGYGRSMALATKFGVTAWPIVFAAIVAQTLKALATYRVERGIRLMTLEQLISSHSVASALKQPFVLRKANWVTLGLLALWALSPLGSQAMQYTTYTQEYDRSYTSDVYYLNTAQDNVALQEIKGSEQQIVADSYSDSMAVLFAAVFQPTSQYQPVGADPWGNPLVPIYETIVSPGQEQGWVEVPQTAGDDTNDFYSSYYGIPLADFDEYDGNWTFVMQSSYLHLDCPFLNLSTIDQVGVDLDQLSSTINGSLSMELNPPTSSGPGNITFLSECSGAQNPNDTQVYAYAFCNLTQTFVNSSVTCFGSNCTVESINKISETPTSMYDWSAEFLKSSDTGLDDYPNLGDSIYSITELYIRDPTNATEPGSGAYCDLSTIGVGMFTKRLSYLLNTFYSTGFTHDYQFGLISKDDPPVTFYRADGTTYNASLTAHTTGTEVYQDYDKPYIYVINWGWLSVFGICSVILLLIGIAGVLLEMMTISPDILGFASSVARNSKYVKLPATDGTMSGAEKARILGETRVMMQDVRPSAEVGKIVLGTVSEGVERLKAGRLYR